MRRIWAGTERAGSGCARRWRCNVRCRAVRSAVPWRWLCGCSRELLRGAAVARARCLSGGSDEAAQVPPVRRAAAASAGAGGATRRCKLQLQVPGQTVPVVPRENQQCTRLRVQLTRAVRLYGAGRARSCKRRSAAAQDGGEREREGSERSECGTSGTGGQRTGGGDVRSGCRTAGAGRT
jgi:hypothetical protein